MPQSWGLYPEQVVEELVHTPFLPGIGLTRANPSHGLLQIPAAQAEIISNSFITNNQYAWANLMAGVDCLGYAQEAFDYSGDMYTWEGLNGGEGRMYPLYTANYSEVIASNPHPASQDQENLKFIKPGDIFYYRNPSTHIAIVERVIRNEDGTVPASGIYIIEAVYNANVAYVWSESRINRVLDAEAFEEKEWVIVRLESN